MKTKSTYRFIAAGVLTLGLTAGSLPAHAASATQIIEGVHTDAISADITNKQLDLFSYADLPETGHTKLNADDIAFYLPDNPATRMRVPAGYEFIAAEGQQVWFAPQNQIQGVLWPGWNTQDISPGEVAGDSLTMELVGAETPQGGSVEIFQSPQLGQDGPVRIWSSDENFKSYQQPVNSHVHANWAFTQKGIYKLTFRVSGTLVDGTPVSDQQTYVFGVGEKPQDGAVETPSPAATTPAAPVEPSAPAETTPAAPATPAAPETPVTPADQPTASQPSAPAPEAPRPPAPAASTPQSAAPKVSQPSSQPTQHKATSPAPAVEAAPEAEAPAAQAPAETTPEEGAPAAGSAGSGVTSSGSSSAAQSTGNQPAAPLEQCMAVEEVVEAAPAQDNSDRAKAGANTASNSDKAEFRPAVLKADRPAFTIQTAVNSGQNRATDGHFDFGAVLAGGNLSAQIKDDRTQPARWGAPQDFTFVLGDAAKTKLPGGMENIAPAGSEVYLIGATQQAGVPWLGWNTQNPELIKQASGPVTLSLKSVNGPGKMSVFLSGNFGGKGTTVFDGPGSSFEVPINTHQHGNWVFTKAGHYTATVEWSVKLKNGSTKTAQGTLHFEVGDAKDAAGSASDAAAGSENRGSGEAGSQGGQQGNDSKAEKQRGTVDEASGIVTKPDGSKVKIVGKTASGADCNLSGEELKNAQQASARGELAYTGSSHVLALVVGGALLTLAGAAALLVARLRKNA